jgi:hypothetical protein
VPAQARTCNLIFTLDDIDPDGRVAFVMVLDLVEESDART